MDALDGSGGINRLRCRDGEQGRALDRQERPEALAARQQRVPHGRAQPRAFAGPARRQQRAEALLGEPGRVTKPLHNPH